MYACVHACVLVCMCVCARMRVCGVCVHVCVFVEYACMHVCIYVCVCVCVFNKQFKCSILEYFEGPTIRQGINNL